MDAERTPSDEFWDASQSENLHYHYTPSAIAQPGSAADVQAAVRCAAAAGDVAVSARSGGHSFAGFGSGGQDGSLIIDMAELSSITLGTGSNPLAEVESGARLGDVIKELWEQGKRAVPKGKLSSLCAAAKLTLVFHHSGTCPAVGVGGHALCGGFGPSSRRWGMTADNIVAADVVLADGSLVRASATENAELWWALRGAGVFFGIVTKFTFSTYDASQPFTFIEYCWSPALHKPEDLTALVLGLQAYASDPKFPSELGFYLQFQKPAKADPKGGTLAVHMRASYGGSLASFKPHADRLWQELARKGIGMADAITEREVDYITLMQEWDDFGAPGHKLDTQAQRLVHSNFIARTVLTLGQRGFSQKALQPVMEHLWKSASALPQTSRARKYAGGVEMEMFGGANARHAAADVVRQTSFPHRDGLWLIQFSVDVAKSGSVPPGGFQWLSRIDELTRAALEQDGIKRASYSCYADPHLSDREWKELYYGSSVPRLVDLKHKLDPNNLFRNPQSLGKRVDTQLNVAGEAHRLTEVEKKEMREWDTHPLPR